MTTLLIELNMCVSVCACVISERFAQINKPPSFPQCLFVSGKQISRSSDRRCGRPCTPLLHPFFLTVPVKTVNSQNITRCE